MVSIKKYKIEILFSVMRNSCIPPLSLKPFCARIMDDLLVAHHILERAIDPFSVERVLLGSQVFPSQKKK